MVHKIVYYMIQGLIKLLIYYIIYHPYGNHKCTLFACQTGPPYSPFAGGRHQSALGPPSISASRPFACTELEVALSIPMADITPIGRGFACFGHI